MGRRVGGWEMERLAGSGEPRRTSRLGAADDEGEHGEGDEQGRRRGRIMAADKSAAAQNPLPDANFSRSRARLGNISRALQLFPLLEHFTPTGPRGNKFPRDFARVTLDYAATCYYANDYAR